MAALSISIVCEAPIQESEYVCKWCVRCKRCACSSVHVHCHLIKLYLKQCNPHTHEHTHTQYVVNACQNEGKKERRIWRFILSRQNAQFISTFSIDNSSFCHLNEDGGGRNGARSSEKSYNVNAKHSTRYLIHFEWKRRDNIMGCHILNGGICEPLIYVTTTSIYLDSFK